jgi:predicted ATPase
MLIEQAEIMSRDLFKSWASCFRGILLIRRGEMADGLQYFDAAFTEFAETRYFRHLRFLSLLAEAHGRAGQIGHGLAVIDKALERSQATEENWCRPEILRVKGELTLLDDGPRGDQAAEALFQDSLDWARRQDALSWELRTATSLARLHHRLDRTPEAAASLSAVYDRFTEGFETADLKTAKSLLDSMT